MRSGFTRGLLLVRMLRVKFLVVSVVRRLRVRRGGWHGTSGLVTRQRLIWTRVKIGLLLILGVSLVGCSWLSLRVSVRTCPKRVSCASGLVCGQALIPAR